jgi:hypothetical protein
MSMLISETVSCMTRQEAEDLLDLIVERAPKLRAAGIRAVNLGGASFTLAAAELEADGDDTELEDGPSDVLHDSWTYGVPPNSATPAILPKRGRSPL